MFQVVLGRRSARRGLRALLCFICFTFAGVGTAVAQKPPPEESKLQAFLNGVGSMIYTSAWPSAKYDGIRFDGVTRYSNGMDVQATVYGRSGWDDSSLWVQVIVEVRNGSLSNFRWGSHNGVFPPGFTIQVATELGKEYARQEAKRKQAEAATAAAAAAQPRESYALCLINLTYDPIVFNYSHGDTTGETTLNARTKKVYIGFGAPDRFEISWDEVLGEEFKPVTVSAAAALKPNREFVCDDVPSYKFTIEGGRRLVLSVNGG